MIHHVSIGTNGVARARSFYDAMMPILGLRLLDGSAVSADYGLGAFLFGIETLVDGEPASVGNGSHIAFAAGRRAMVARFYEVALQHGGRDAGAPGLRPQSDGNYHGAFVLDPDGHKIEAVTYQASEAGRPSYRLFEPR